mmetsp:Transcript_14315/g.25588  ORF Transcript_14315/g.25588 Transcript_14315/m.25588 type:complete len:150 (+) Transcript_14315:232-681(+)
MDAISFSSVFTLNRHSFRRELMTFSNAVTSYFPLFAHEWNSSNKTHGSSSATDDTIFITPLFTTLLWWCEDVNFFLEENIIGDDDGTGIKNADTLLAERINANERAAPSGEMGCIRRVIVGTRVEISRGIFYEVGVIWFRADEKGNDEV